MTSMEIHAVSLHNEQIDSLQAPGFWWMTGPLQAGCECRWQDLYHWSSTTVICLESWRRHDQSMRRPRHWRPLHILPTALLQPPSCTLYSSSMTNLYSCGNMLLTSNTWSILFPELQSASTSSFLWFEHVWNYIWHWCDSLLFNFQVSIWQTMLRNLPNLCTCCHECHHWRRTNLLSMNRMDTTIRVICNVLLRYHFRRRIQSSWFVHSVNLMNGGVLREWFEKVRRYQVHTRVTSQLWIRVWWFWHRWILTLASQMTRFGFDYWNMVILNLSIFWWRRQSSRWSGSDTSQFSHTLWSRSWFSSYLSLVWSRCCYNWNKRRTCLASYPVRISEVWEAVSNASQIIAPRRISLTNLHTGGVELPVAFCNPEQHLEESHSSWL